MACSIAWGSHLQRYFVNHAARIRFLGLMTYPLYLVHEPVAYFVIYCLHSWHVGQYAAWLGGLLSSFVAAWTVTKWLEPWTKAKTKEFMEIVVLRLERQPF
jgi:peptidoglycan/LPS O-acetylase OafA/YrhL